MIIQQKEPSMTAQKKYRRTTIGSVIKSKNADSPNYIKMNLKQLGGAVTLTDGMTLSVESKAFQIRNLEQAVATGKLNQEVADKILERVLKIPDFVLGEIVLVNKN